MNPHVDNRIERLDAIEAAEAWLARNFAHDEEIVLITAIRRSLVLDLSDVEIKEVLYHAAENECSGADVVRDLLDADKGSEGMSRSSLKPR